MWWAPSGSPEKERTRLTESAGEPCFRDALLSDRPDGCGSSRIDSDRHDLLHHVNCVHLLSSPLSVRFTTSNLLLRFAFVVPCVFSRRLHVFGFQRWTIPSSRSSQIFTEPITAIFTIFTEPVASYVLN